MMEIVITKMIIKVIFIIIMIIVMITTITIMMVTMITMILMMMKTPTTIEISISIIQKDMRTLKIIKVAWTLFCIKEDKMKKKKKETIRL